MHTHTTYRRRALPSLPPSSSNHPRQQISRPCLAHTPTHTNGNVRAHSAPRLPTRRPTTLRKFILTPPHDVNVRGSSVSVSYLRLSDSSGRGLLLAFHRTHTHVRTNEHLRTRAHIRLTRAQIPLREFIYILHTG